MTAHVPSENTHHLKPPPLGTEGCRDSFLVREGRVLLLPKHVTRMSYQTGVSTYELIPVYLRALEAAERANAIVFPLVTYRDGVLDFDLRPGMAADLQTSAKLWTSDEPDPRQFPRYKGPDFPYQRFVQASAIGNGADEAVLVNSEGFVREGAFSSIVFWCDGTLNVVSDSARLLGVTEQAVLNVAAATGAPVRRRAFTSSEGREANEVWILNARHGIRVVTEWDGFPLCRVGLAQDYRARLQEMEWDIPRLKAFLAQQLGHRP